MKEDEAVSSKHIAVLWKECSGCHGSGNERYSYYSEKCYTCYGKGGFRVISKEDVLDLIRDNLHSLLRDAKIEVVKAPVNPESDAIDSPAEKTSEEFARLLAEE